MKKAQYITRKTNLSCGHRVMNESRLCYNLHGHEYITELTFSFESMESIGYALDFKEIKRVLIEYLQVYMDHGMLLNPKDTVVIDAVKTLGTKLWLMSLNGEGEYCNPSVENIAKEVFLAMEILTDHLYGHMDTRLRIHNVKIYETPNCWTDCVSESISREEQENFYNARYKEIVSYAEKMGVLEYDDRKM